MPTTIIFIQLKTSAETQDLSANSGQQGQKCIKINDTGILSSPLIKNDCNWKCLTLKWVLPATEHDVVLICGLCIEL